MLKQPLSVLEGEKGDELEDMALKMFYTIQQHAGEYITSKCYSVGARLSGRTRYWCNRSVIKRCNLPVSDMYMNVFGKDAPDSLYVLLCRYIRSQATHKYISRSAAS